MKTMKTTSNKSYFIIGGLCVAAVAGGSSLAVLTRSSKAEGVPKELTVDALRTQAKDATPGQVFDKMRETMERDDLTEEQRQKARDNMRQVGREMMEQRVDEYFSAATQEEKNAILDRQLDEFMAMREEWEKRRAEREKNGEREGEQERQNWMAQQSQEERKARSESRSPDQMARMMAYFTAMQVRAGERGIKMPGRGGGGFGGFGGGPGRGGRGP
jgi:hypothetical protein